MAEPVVYREEATAIVIALSDLVTNVKRIRELLQEDDDEEEDDES